MIEALYQPGEALEAWARGVVDTFGKVFPLDSGGAAIVVIGHDSDTDTRSVPLVVGVGRSAEFQPDADISPLSRRMFDALFYTPSLVMSHSTTAAHVSPDDYEALRGMHAQWGFRDAVGFVAHPEPGVVAFIARPLGEETAPSRYERRLFSQAALHLESAFRLRRCPEAVLAVFGADGRALHLEDEDLDAQALSARVGEIDTARTRARRTLPDALDPWDALVAGGASIVERFDGGKRYYVLLENPPSRRRHRALTRREVEVLRKAARGLSVKQISYGLGLSSPVVSNSLASAAAKLGLPGRLDLVRAASALLDTPGAPVDPTHLTASEREIFELVRLGLSNVEIAERRSRSVHTVANQVSAILHKTGRATRRGIVGSR